MVLTEGITEGGRKPATMTATAAANKAYSIMSWPRWSFAKVCRLRHSRLKCELNPNIVVLRLPCFHLEPNARYEQLRKCRSRAGKRPYDQDLTRQSGRSRSAYRRFGAPGPRRT